MIPLPSASPNSANSGPAVLTDIEGTTGSIAFVRDVLFPYARERLGTFLAARAGAPEVARIRAEAAGEVGRERLGPDEAADLFRAWMDEDRKATPLKALQGLIWERGYRDGTLVGHVYDDAAAALRRWHRAGIPLYVYSSGSVAAQRLLFRHSSHGDLTPLFAGYFDTTTGPKTEPASYQRIAAAIGRPAPEIVFLSDGAAEIRAAHEAGMRTVWMVRPGNPPAPGEAPPCDLRTRSFEDIDIAALAVG